MIVKFFKYLIVQISLWEQKNVIKKTSSTDDVNTKVYTNIIGQEEILLELAPSYQGGCRSVIGPVPRLLWMNM